MTLHNLLSSSVSFSQNFVGNEADLQRISSDLLYSGYGFPPAAGDNFVDDVALGRKQVSVPPGKSGLDLIVN